MDDALPPPAVQRVESVKKRTAFASNTPPSGGFRVHWARLKRRINTSSNEDAPSESYVDTLDGSVTWRRASDHPGSYTNGWNHIGGQEKTESDEVDEIVVDQHFEGYSQDGAESQTGRTASEKHGDRVTSSLAPHTDKESTTTVSVWDRFFILNLLRWRVLPGLSRFNSLAFNDPVAEAQYSREAWYSSKTLAIFAGLWLILNWVITCGLVPRPMSNLDKGFYFAWTPVFTLPVPILVIFDWPRKKQILYQGFITISVWSWSAYNISYIYICGYYRLHPNTCGAKGFDAVLYFAAAYPTIAIFALQMKRLPALIAPLSVIILISVLVVPDRHAWARNVVNLLIFHTFMLYIHFTREQAERRLYTLRDQVKFQYRATQKAQVSERKTGDSKRRLTSYIFHEVRVPLNTAMLALQNLEATLPKGDEDQAIEVGALATSLNMMSKDDNRMDAGRFESVSKPFCFHKVIRSSMVGLQLAVDAKGLELVTHFDRNIDMVARATSFREEGKSEEWIAWQLGMSVDEDAYLMGDEMRLIQVVTNLTSNACKFTPAGPGGRVTVITKLIHPSEPLPIGSESTAVSSSPDNMEKTSPTPPVALDSIENNELSMTQLSKHDKANEPRLRRSRRAPQNIVVRIEVHDTGVGIRPRDMIDNRLFSPYVQTEIGRHQGGKGTGLGLALVRHIVKLSGGRLGVQSKRDAGSCFWAEFPLGIVRNAPETPDVRRSSSSPFPVTPLPQRDPFSKLSPDGQSIPTPGSEWTNSSSAPSNFLDLVGPSVPTETHDALTDTEVQYPPKVFKLRQPSSTKVVATTSFTPSSPSSNNSNTPTNSPRLGPSSPTAPPLPQTLSAAHHSTSTSISTLEPFSSAPIPLVTDSTRPTMPARTMTAPGRPHLIRLPTPQLVLTQRDTDPWKYGQKPSSDGASSSGTPGSPSTVPEMNSIRALVVDDDQMTRRLMERMLQRIGCSVETAENGQLALDMIKANRLSEPLNGTSTENYDVVFLDNQMPILSGVDMVKKLRECGRKDFIVGITGNALKEDQVEYMEAGLDRVLTKPVLEKSLKDMLRIAIDRRRRGSVSGSPVAEKEAGR